MTDKADFLSLLRRNKDDESTGSILKNPVNLKIQISVDKRGASLCLVDHSGKIQSPDEYETFGAIGPLIKTLTNIEGKSRMDFSWGIQTSENKFSFADYPFLTSFLEACHDIIVDKNLNPLTFIDEKRKATFYIKTGDGKKSSGNKGDFFVHDEKIVAFLSPGFALTGNSVCQVENVGDRFADLMAFTPGFDNEMSEIFLSILFSNIDKVKVDFGGRKVIMPKESVPFIPVLAIEKIDSDNSLHLKVTETAGNMPMDICENFSLKKVAYITDKEIVVRTLEKSHLHKNIDILRSNIEKNASKKELKGIWSDGNFFVVPQEVASKFLYNSLGSLIALFKIVGAEKLKAYKIVAARPKLNLRLGSGIDYLEGQASVKIENQEFTLRDLLAQYGKQKYVTLSDGNRAVVDSTYMKRLQRIFNNKDKGDNVKISFFDLPEVMELLDDKEKSSKSFEAYRDFYQGFNSLRESHLITPGLKAKLRDYQKEGVKWINYLYTNNMGGCLADDMGLGKTVQTIAMLTRCVPKATKPSLIVMPKSLLFNWQEEFKKFAPEIKVTTHYGPNRNFEESMKGQVILTSYAMLRNDIETFINQQFEYVILDESQNIKNVDTQVTKAVWLLKGAHRLAISGTPIENNLSELYSLFHFLNPAMFGSLKEFSDKYATPIQKDGDEEAANALRRKVFPFILRRLKSDVLTDLPERTEQVLTVEMSPQQEALYEERRKYFAGEIENTIAKSGVNKASFELLQALLELRQIASVPEEKSNGNISSPKIDLLMEYLMSAVRNGHKVVVFYNFLAGIELTAHKLDLENISYEVMTGATRDRKKVVERFQNDDECRVMLMTIKSGGVGLNLVAADTVFVVEPWWNKATEEQAINRLHRIGQKKSVNCYFLITAGTIEEKIRQLQEKKSALVDAVISTDSSGGKNLSAEDINYLLS
ncbi:MAG: DEAD/DEAH box helicase [Bacteroides sp.]|nr:DEAD/DEAH box helicase [Bacteroides sp.]